MVKYVICKYAKNKYIYKMNMLNTYLYIIIMLNTYTYILLIFSKCCFILDMLNICERVRLAYFSFSVYCSAVQCMGGGGCFTYCVI